MWETDNPFFTSDGWDFPHLISHPTGGQLIQGRRVTPFASEGWNFPHLVSHPTSGQLIRGRRATPILLVKGGIFLIRSPIQLVDS
jgi:hypothetical protein